MNRIEVKRMSRKAIKYQNLFFLSLIYSIIATVVLIGVIAVKNNDVKKYNGAGTQKIETINLENIVATTASAEEPIQKQGITEKFTITAYCPCSKCCGKWANGITSTGVKATAGRTIAVDPKKIPYGTEVVINGHTYIAEDCGGAIKGNKIDIFFNTHQEALKWGRQIKYVTILK